MTPSQVNELLELAARFPGSMLEMDFSGRVIVEAEGYADFEVRTTVPTMNQGESWDPHHIGTLNEPRLILENGVTISIEEARARVEAKGVRLH